MGISQWENPWVELRNKYRTRRRAVEKEVTIMARQA
jgi:hypothetical protein